MIRCPRINDDITATELRVMDAEKQPLGVFSKEEAQKMADCGSCSRKSSQTKPQETSLLHGGPEPGGSGEPGRWPRRRGGCGGRWRRAPWRGWRGEGPGPGPRAPAPRGEAPAPRLLTGGGGPGARRAQEAACDEACQKRSAQAQIYFVSALMLVILACGLACAANIRTPDRFDTPKESQD